MAIRLDITEDSPNLFCDSKWWGDPDMPEDMEYPMLDGYPLTFICQIAGYDIERFDPEGVLPHDGMFYFFAAIDEFLGYESPIKHDGAGEWPKGHAVVKYTKAVNMETFKSVILLDDEDNPISQKAQRLEFSACQEDFAGFRILGAAPEGYVNLLRIPLDPQRTLSFRIKQSDLGFGNWKKARLSLEVLQ